MEKGRDRWLKAEVAGVLEVDPNSCPQAKRKTRILCLIRVYVELITEGVVGSFVNN
jgi:hypothetical protein